MINGITSYNFYNTYFKNVMNSYDGKNQVPNLFSMAVAAIYSDKVNTNLSKEISGFFSNIHKNLESLNENIENLMSQEESNTLFEFDQEKSDESVNVLSFGNQNQNVQYAVSQDPFAQTNKSNVFGQDDLFNQEQFGSNFSITRGDESFQFQLENQGQDSTVGDVFHIIAENIRNSDAGLSAEVILTDNNETFLNISSNETGLDAGFDVQGDLAQSLGFDQVFVEAQNFQIEINGQEYESQDYLVETEEDIEIDFTNYEEDSGSISIEFDRGAIEDKLRDFTEGINDTLNFLEESSNRNLNILGKQIENDLSRYEEDLRNVGITIAGDRLNFRSIDEDVSQNDISNIFSNDSGLANSVNRRVNIFENRTLFNNVNLLDSLIPEEEENDFLYTQGYNVLNQTGAILDLRI